MITDRIKHLMESKGLSAVLFAEKLGIQRSGLSHLFSGRNRPSLDLILKILEVFPDVTPEWLLRGQGDLTRILPSNTSETTEITSVNTDMNRDVIIETLDNITDVNLLNSEDVTPVITGYVPKTFPEVAIDQEPVPVPEVASAPENAYPSVTGVSDDEIVVLYPDGTYRSFAKRK